MVVNAHKGLYKYTRLPYGIASAPAIFWNVMESFLVIFQVLDRLEKSNMHLKFHKCSFNQNEVRYLGHRINSAGIKPLPDKLRAIAMAPESTDVSELRHS